MDEGLLREPFCFLLALGQEFRKGKPASQTKMTRTVTDRPRIIAPEFMNMSSASRIQHPAFQAKIMSAEAAAALIPAGRMWA